MPPGRDRRLTQRLGSAVGLIGALKQTSPGDTPNPRGWDGERAGG